MFKKFLFLVLLTAIAVTTVNAAEKYALLITGDYAAGNRTVEWGDGESAVNGRYEEFWHDTYLTWEMLQDRGYKDENIFVLFADGVDYWTNNYVHSRYTPMNVNFEGTITDYSATLSNLQAVASELESLTNDDFLYIWTFDHGGTSGSNATLCLMDGVITDVDFAALFTNVNAHKKVINMQQCFSGGFINNFLEENTYIHTASGWEFARPADDKTETGVYIPQH